MPALWWLEIVNVTLIAERRAKIARAQRRAWLDRIARLGFATDQEAARLAWPEIAGLAERHGLTAYDAVYLELAVRRGLPLGTLDRDLARAAMAEGIPIHPA